MASVSGLMEQARGYLPEFVARRRRNYDDANPATTVRGIAELIERQIVPVIAMARARSAAPVDTHGFAMLALERDAGALLVELEKMMTRGMTVEDVLVDVLAPTARRLGTMWEDDYCDFVDVTMGLWRLQEVVRELSSRSPILRAAAFNARTALFAPMPGDHSFGTIIVEEVFRRNGWVTTMIPDASRALLLADIGDNAYDLVGLTVSCDSHIARLQSLIVAMRAVSKNPRVCVMLGGRVLMNDPQLCNHVGADGTAVDAQQALEVAGRLIMTNTCREVFGA